MNGQCIKCEFSRKTMQMNQPQLLCCYEPPRLMPMMAQAPGGGMTQNFIALSPPVDDTHCCGKFSPDHMSRQ